MRIEWIKGHGCSLRTQEAITRAFAKAAPGSVALVDRGGSFMILSPGAKSDPPDGFSPVAQCFAGGDAPIQLEAPANDELRERIATLQDALRDRNEAIDRVMAQRDSAITERDALAARVTKLEADLATAEDLIGDKDPPTE